MLRRISLVAGALTLALMASACTADPEPTKPPEASSSPKPHQVTRMTFGAYGSPAELKAMQKIVDSFNSASQARRVELVTWDSHEAAMRDVMKGDAPDVFMTSRDDVAALADGDLVRPMGLLLDERGVDFGDRYSRDALDAFAHDSELQCMAYSISPMVIYYNSDLVDFDAMAESGEYNVPTNLERWTINQFAAAAEYASRDRGVKGVYIEPTIEALTPFIASAGGEVYKDDQTSLNFSSDESRDALERTLHVLRDPLVTPGAKMLANSTPIELFKQGRLGMIAGYRDLVPELRKTADLNFDVISMPYLGSAATVGDIEGLCISSGTGDVNVAADFIAYAVSDSAIETMTNTGYIVPANTHAASSEVFLAEDLQPHHARVFTNSIRGMVPTPFIEKRGELDAVINPLLEALLNGPGVLDLDAATEAIDLASRAVLDPEFVLEPTESPSPTPSN